MNNFDKRFADFDRDFSRTKKWILIVNIIIASIGLGLVGFGVWVIVMLLYFFGVI